MGADLKLVRPDERILAVSDEELTRAALGALSDGVGGAGGSEVKGEQIIRAAIASEARARSRRRSVAALGLTFGMAAAAALYFDQSKSSEADQGVLLQARSGDVRIRVDGSYRAASEGDAAEQQLERAPGAVKTGAASSVTVRAGEAVLANVVEQSELSWGAAPGEELSLDRGRASFAVESLKAGRTFSVRAGDARVTVHGTKFTVTLHEEGAAACIVVEEGLVAVERPGSTTWVRAGQNSGCEPVAIEEEAAPVDILEGDESKRSAKTPRAQASGRGPDSAESSLAAQNALFQKALVAQRAGDEALALKRLDEFARLYPDSPLIAQVRVQQNSLRAKTSVRSP